MLTNSNGREAYRQGSGYAIVRRMEYVMEEYKRLADTERLKALQVAVEPLEPLNYRGVDRDPLHTLPPEDAVDAFAASGLDMETERRARARMRELLGDDYDEDGDDEDFNLLLTASDAADAFSFVVRPEQYEIVFIARDALQKREATLGYDVGWWANYSIIRDSIVAPLWHGPPNEEFSALAGAVRDLNEHVLFGSPDQAEAFMKYYKTTDWGETGQFCVMQVDAVSID